ncbi:efflux RND transporter periplasmic adaptor subunit [Roseibium denhamense]|uniref:RND family efflux transporter, MFP subunit n=1 Tax=Roseibium denhamense TaxID=76305 RepID=A0ABY1P3P4_9HYPH|nr:efflux RND transporter periplasmic adaptor subunit [Roseibium denhamense]MTI07593.1 efflux RND transporter periplasmic adaptor subunit [Roseibium denhamense]SMP24025.1 RND family efflux transporter, MFP subunit [Roseibium denhamense]
MSDTYIQKSETSARQWIWIILSITVLGAILLLVLEAEDTANVTIEETPPPRPVVTIVEVVPADAVAKISAFAELRPRWDAEIRAAVSGRITKVHPAALAGERVAAGTPLFSIDKNQYETDVAAAELRLEEAKLSRWRAQNAVALARRDYARAGTEPPNELALRLPELRIAERLVASAEAGLRSSQHQLADTDVVAPFSGFVTRRMASLGQTVTAGEGLIHLSDDHQYELMVELSQTDWALLDHPVAGQEADILHRDGTQLGQARVRQGGGFLDPQTRQQRLFLDVIGPNAALLAGDFVQAVFLGRTIPATLTLPETALTREGHVWLVDPDELLVRTTPEILFRSGSSITIAANSTEPKRIAVTPLASFMPGQQVSPRPVEE